MDPAFRSIVGLLSSLPGIGPRHATRIALALLDRSPEELAELGDAIGRIHERIRQCDQCFNVSDDLLCAVCRDRRRDAQSIMVLEKITDLESVERARIWRGTYHVLGGALSPADGVGPERLRFAELASRVDRIVRETGSLELVLATNPTAAGEMTALYIRDMFAGVPGITTTRLARGLPTGAHLEYADEITLKHALDARR